MRGRGLTSVGGCAIILVATLACFVPELGLMSSGTLSDPDNVLIRFLPETAVARDVSYEAGA